jgi:intracellular sulfur oxidation DsrE/DsrF family protein
MSEPQAKPKRPYNKKAKGAAMATKEPAIQKPPGRGPGRPPSAPPVPKLATEGVVGNPTNPIYRVEFVYGQPVVLRSLFTYLKNIKAQDVHIRFAPKGITFFARDHIEKSKVITTLDGSTANFYYCSDEFFKTLKRELVDNMFSSIDKSFYKCTILYSRLEPEVLRFVFTDPALEKECSYRINLSSYTPDTPLYAAEDLLDESLINVNFPLQFTLKACQFKKTFSEICKSSNKVTIEKMGDGPIRLIYSIEGVVYHESYLSPSAIKMVSNIPEDIMFSATLSVENIKYLAGAMVAENIRMFCRNDGDILFKTDDPGSIMVVNTLTTLIEP